MDELLIVEVELVSTVVELFVTMVLDKEEFVVVTGIAVVELMHEEVEAVLGIALEKLVIVELDAEVTTAVEVLEEFALGVEDVPAELVEELFALVLKVLTRGMLLVVEVGLHVIVVVTMRLHVELDDVVLTNAGAEELEATVEFDDTPALVELEGAEVLLLKEVENAELVLLAVVLEFLDCVTVTVDVGVHEVLVTIEEEEDVVLTGLELVTTLELLLVMGRDIRLDVGVIVADVLDFASAAIPIPIAAIIMMTMTTMAIVESASFCDS